MDKNYLTMTLPNMITVCLMAGLGFTLLALATKFLAPKAAADAAK